MTLKALHDFVIKGFFIQARRAGGCGSPLQKRPVGVFQLDKGETYLKTMDCFDQLNVSFFICTFICRQEEVGRLPGPEVIKLDSFSCVRKQPIIALYFEFETVLKFYNLEARVSSIQK